MCHQCLSRCSTALLHRQKVFTVQSKKVGFLAPLNVMFYLKSSDDEGHWGYQNISTLGNIIYVEQQRAVLPCWGHEVPQRGGRFQSSGGERLWFHTSVSVAEALVPDWSH